MSQLPSLFDIEIMIPLFTTETLLDLSMKINEEIKRRQTSEIVPDEVTEEDINYFESQLPK